MGDLGGMGDLRRRSPYGSPLFREGREDWEGLRGAGIENPAGSRGGLGRDSKFGIAGDCRGGITAGNWRGYSAAARGEGVL